MKRKLLSGMLLFVSLTMLACSAQAQIVSDSSGFAVSSALGTSLTWSHVVGNSANRILVVGVQLRIDSGGSNPGATTRVTAVTFGGTALTCLVAWPITILVPAVMLPLAPPVFCAVKSGIC